MENVTLTTNLIIKHLRKAFSLSQQELADICEVAQQEYSRWEQDGYKVNFKNLTKIALFYNISLDCFSGVIHEYKPFNADIDYDQSSAYQYFLKYKSNVVKKKDFPHIKDVFENIACGKEYITDYIEFLNN